MEKSLVNLNVNPCKMCMPMGAVTAMYGIRKCMTILHGSQGCSTYMRRHMATHYNEPVDIASSSLTEEGTVYGGEENLMEGLKNMIKVYHPEVIGVATTCLAETIGEDVKRIIQKFYEKNIAYRKIPIIPIPSAGYAGTQYEGFFQALYEMVKNIPMDRRANHKVNVITGLLSPADTRYLKSILESFDIDYILLPDLSDNLDRGYEEAYERLPSKGTSVKDIGMMAGAKITLELSNFTSKENSPAEYLYEHYGVPYIKLHLPMSIRDNDAFINQLKTISNREIPTRLIEDRSRYLDAMVDSHKYNGEGRAVIFGEPDFVYGTVRLCVENGVFPLVVATGSKCTKLKELLYEEIKQLADTYFIECFEILDDVDFQTIEDYGKKLGANLLIGNSDARRMEEHLDIPLVRRAFPIHDRIGGQRLRTIGYEGTLTFLDDITNGLLGRKESRFRKEIYEKFYQEEDRSQEITKEESGFMKLKKTDHEQVPLSDKSIEEKTKTHPCYNCGAGDYARIHLPVAPKCNISCNYCLRKYDCPNESRPGVTTKVLTPEEAYERYKEVEGKVKKLSVVGIAGPGDALANFEKTRETLKRIRVHNPDITFCLSTNGLLLPMYANELIELGVSHVTVTMNTVDPKIGEKIYKYVDYMGVRYEGEQGAAILLANQLAGIKMLTQKGIMCKVNVVMLKGINEEYIPEVVKKVKELGGAITNIMQLIPVKGSVFEDLPLVSNKEIMEMRKNCGETMKQMYHCKQCRADAIGTLGNDRSIEFNKCKGGCDRNKPEQTINIEETVSKDLEQKEKTLKFAAATKSGMLIDQHFGQVSELYIYEYLNGNAIFKEKRTIKKYCQGSDLCLDSEDKITMILNTIADCDGIIAMRIGHEPTKKLEKQGIHVFTTYNRIEDAVKEAASNMLKN